MSLGELFHFARMLSKAGPSLEDVLNKEKKPCIYVGMTPMQNPSAISMSTWA